MRTIIDLPESQLAALRELEQRKHVSRAELIRQAVAQYVMHHILRDRLTNQFSAGNMFAPLKFA